MTTATWVSFGAALGAAAAAAVLFVPRRVHYEDSVVVEAAPQRVYDCIRFQSHLMRWSAWPSETGSTCELEHTDGQVGARTVFISTGRRFGHQEVTRLVPGREVELRLVSKGPPQQPVVTFRLQPVDAGSTRVTLAFDNDIRRPFNVLLRVAGIVRWTRAMHRKDLDGLRRYAGPPHVSYAGEPAVSVP